MHSLLVCALLFYACFCNDAKIQAREERSDISSMHIAILPTKVKSQHNQTALLHKTNKILQYYSKSL